MAREEDKTKKYNFIYKTTRFDGVFYIGMHSTNNLDDGYLGSGKYLVNSINKHGRDKHVREILEFAPTRGELIVKEKEIITTTMVENPLCMNIREGGLGGWDHITPDKKRAGGLASGPKNLVKARANAFTKEAIEKRVASFKGRHPKKFQNSFGHGSKHTDATKEKMAKSKSGSSNNQFGKCWITNGKATKSIFKDELNFYLEQGYVRGRTLIRKS